jgi:YVTN family beta-propeller protein
MRAFCLTALAAVLVGCGGSTQPGYRVLVTNENSGDVSVIDGAKLEVIATIPVGKRPRGILAGPDGRSVYVALSGSPAAPPGVDESTLPPPDKSADGVGIIDVASNKLTRTIHAGSDPEQFDLSRDGAYLYVSNEDSAELSIVELATGKVVTSVKVGEEPEGVRTTPGGKFVYVTAENDGTITVIDTTTHAVVKTIKVGRRPRSIAFLHEPAHAYVTNENDGTVTVIDAARQEVLREIELGPKGVIKPMGIALSPDRKRAYVSTGRGKKVFIIDTPGHTVAGSFEVGTRPWGITVSPDGKTLFAADGPSNEVVVVDLATQNVTKRIKAGQSPWGAITVAP